MHPCVAQVWLSARAVSQPVFKASRIHRGKQTPAEQIARAFRDGRQAHEQLNHIIQTETFSLTSQGGENDFVPQKRGYSPCSWLTCTQEMLGTRCLDQALSILWSFPPQETHFFSFKGNILRQENAFSAQNKNIHSLFLSVPLTPVVDRMMKVDRGFEGRNWCSVSTNAL